MNPHVLYDSEVFTGRRRNTEFLPPTAPTPCAVLGGFSKLMEEEGGREGGREGGVGYGYGHFHKVGGGALGGGIGYAVTGFTFSHPWCGTTCI